MISVKLITIMLRVFLMIPLKSCELDNSIEVL